MTWSGKTWFPRIDQSAWRWFAAEITVVVAGVLIALSLNAMWEGRRDRKSEQAYLRAIITDLDSTSVSLARTIAADETDLRAISNLLAASFNPNQVPRDSVALWVRRSTSVSLPTFSVGTARALVATGDLQLVRSDSARLAISRHCSTSSSYRGREVLAPQFGRGTEGRPGAAPGVGADALGSRVEDLHEARGGARRARIAGRRSVRRNVAGGRHLGAVIGGLRLALCGLFRFRAHRRYPLSLSARSVAAEMHSGFASLRTHMSMNVRRRYPDKGRTSEVLAEIRRIDEICQEVSAAIADGARVIVLSDRHADQFNAPIPSLLLTGAVHHHLVREKTRTQVGLLVEAGDVREVHHVALLVGFGAAAVNPYLAMETVEDLARQGYYVNTEPEQAVKNLIKGLGKGVVKVPHIGFVKIGSVGRPLGGTTVRVADDGGSLLVATATDDCGNETSCTFTVTVGDCPEEGCSLTQGYWKNHPNNWPVTSITMGCKSYSRADAIKIMKKSAAGDKTYSMAAQLIATKLNLANGNNSSCITATVAAADTWLQQNPLGSGAKKTWTQGEPLHKALDDYNNGRLCASHMD